jgi:tetraacyldisaccharide 4'-kinase
MRAPNFWRAGGNRVLAALLSPAAAIVAVATARRVAKPGWRAPVPVICCGNLTVGGAGKTTLAIDLASRLLAQNRRVHILLRGYGGSSRGVRRVGPDDPASLVGDEARLLAAIAPTWIGGDRAASARAAITAGAEGLVMDDGLQNPTLEKTFSCLVIDGPYGFGNGRVMPAGPLREPIATGAARANAAILIGPDETNSVRQLPPSLPVLRAMLVPDATIGKFVGQRVLAFAGIATPEKFFRGLEAAGVILAQRRPFPDHHPFTRHELAAIVADAKKQNATAVTTPKDAARIKSLAGIEVVGVQLEWHDPAALDALLASLWSTQ